MTDQAAQTPKDDLIRGYRDEIARLHRCITMAMGCLDPESQNRDERLAWFRLFDAEIGNGKEPRNDLPTDAPKATPPKSPGRIKDWHYDRNGYCDNPGRGY